MSDEKLTALEKIAWVFAYMRSLPALDAPSLPSAEKNAWDTADRVVERMRDEKMRREIERTAKKQRPADPEDQGDDDLNY